MTMDIHLKVVGSLLILLSLMHIIIPKFFKWDQEVTTLTLITRQILYVHTFFIAFILMLMGLLCIGYSNELLRNPLGKILSLGLSCFWLTRLFFQFFVYSPKLWRGKRFETTMHVVFSLAWVYFTGVFLISYLQKL
jgi:hypothetical protein